MGMEQRVIQIGVALAYVVGLYVALVLFFMVRGLIEYIGQEVREIFAAKK